MSDQQSDLIKAIITEELNDIIHIRNVFDLSFNRSLSLIHRSKRLHKIIDDSEFIDYMNDVVRAAIVFIHSALETSLREIIRVSLKAKDLDISYIPLVALDEIPSRKEKYTLKDLATHRGKTIEQVINESIDQYLRTLSFNNTTDIANGLKKIQLPSQTVEQYYSNLNDMIQRRHQIVHEGDLKRIRGSSLEFEPVDLDKLLAWIDSTAKFFTEVLHLMVQVNYSERILKRLESAGIQIDEATLSKMIKINQIGKFDN